MRLIFRGGGEQKNSDFTPPSQAFLPVSALTTDETVAGDLEFDRHLFSCRTSLPGWRSNRLFAR